MQEDVNDTEAQSLLLTAVTAGAPFSKASSGGIVILVIQLPFGLVFSCTLLSRPSIHTVGESANKILVLLFRIRFLLA